MRHLLTIWHDATLLAVRRRLRELEKQLDLRQDVSLRVAAADDIRAENERLLARLSDSSAQIRALQHQLRSVQRDFEDAQIDRISLQKGTKIKALEQEFEAVLADRDAAAGRVAYLEDVLIRTQNEAQGHERKFGNLLSEVARANAQTASMTEEIHCLRQNIHDRDTVIYQQGQVVAKFEDFKEMLRRMTESAYPEALPAAIGFLQFCRIHGADVSLLGVDELRLDAYVQWAADGFAGALLPTEGVQFSEVQFPTSGLEVVGSDINTSISALPPTAPFVHAGPPQQQESFGTGFAEVTRSANVTVPASSMAPVASSTTTTTTKKRSAPQAPSPVPVTKPPVSTPSQSGAATPKKVAAEKPIDSGVTSGVAFQSGKRPGTFGVSSTRAPALPKRGTTVTRPSDDVDDARLRQRNRRQR